MSTRTHRLRKGIRVQDGHTAAARDMDLSGMLVWGSEDDGDAAAPMSALPLAIFAHDAAWEWESSCSGRTDESDWIVRDSRG